MAEAEAGSRNWLLAAGRYAFTGTLAENIAQFGEIDSTQLIATAKMAGIHDMILRMPDGYNTLTGEQGMALSGGQKQRIGLARALYGNPALVILDEPNAHLDESGEQALQQVIRQLRQQKKVSSSFLIVREYCR